MFRFSLLDFFFHLTPRKWFCGLKFHSPLWNDRHQRVVQCGLRNFTNCKVTSTREVSWWQSLHVVSNCCLELTVSSSFKQFLELEPQLRDILHNFYDSKYASCLKLLAEIRVSTMLSVYGRERGVLSTCIWSQ